MNQTVLRKKLPRLEHSLRLGKFPESLLLVVTVWASGFVYKHLLFKEVLYLPALHLAHSASK